MSPPVAAPLAARLFDYRKNARAANSACRRHDLAIADRHSRDIRRTGPPMNRICLFLAAAVSMALLPMGQAGASVVCSQAIICDEQQIGPYVAPDMEAPDLEGRFDPRGRPVPIPGLEGIVRHRPGAGVWLGEAPGAGNLFLKPGRDRLTLDMKLDF
jgi:hypothetical protein